MNTQNNNYEQQANDFLAKTNTYFSAKYIKTGKYFTDDKEERDIYEIELKRGNRSYAFKFGQSIQSSGEYLISIYVRNNIKINRKFAHEKELPKFRIGYLKNDIVKNVNFSAPTPYSVLASITKYDPGTLEDFCNEYGYDVDSKKAGKTYLAVKDEYLRVCGLFTPEEMEELYEIS